VFADSRRAVLKSLLLTDGGNLGISQRLSNTLQEFPRGYPITFGHFPAASQYPIRISKRLLNSLWAFQSDFSIPFQQCSAAVQYPEREFPRGYRQKLDSFHPLSLKCSVSDNIYFKKRRNIGKLNI
jgi:hypothetical protein